MQSQGYSICLCLENLGLVVFPYIIGQIHDNTDEKSDAQGYFWVNGFLSVLVFISFLSTIGVMFYEREFGYPLKYGNNKMEKMKI